MTTEATSQGKRCKLFDALVVITKNVLKKSFKKKQWTTIKAWKNTQHAKVRERTILDSVRQGKSVEQLVNKEEQSLLLTLTGFFPHISYVW